jgi:pyruvate,orthophosphate dikinase
VVARQLGKVCIVGCADLTIDLRRRSCRIGTTALGEGDEITLDGSTGKVYAGRVAVAEVRPDDLLARIGTWKAELNGK